MLNPVLSNTKIIIGTQFFPETLTKKYDDYLYGVNYPLKTLELYLHETIQQITIPGIDLQTIDVEALPNVNNNPPNSPDFFHDTHVETYEGTVSQAETISAREATITFKNTIINWMYLYEYCFEHYKRNRQTTVGSLFVMMYNAAEVPVLQFHMQRAFISSMPGLEFAFNASFSESKTFDVNFKFNQIDVKFILPDINHKVLSLE